MKATLEDAADAYAAACPTRSALPRLVQKCDLLVTTGANDADVPPDLSKTFAAAATDAKTRTKRVEYLEFANADHYDVMNATHPTFAQTWAKLETMLES